MRICNATAELKTAEEITLKSPAFKGWAVRVYRTGKGFDSEYLHAGEPVPLCEMTGPFTSAMLQNETWEIAARKEPGEEK